MFSFLILAPSLFTPSHCCVNRYTLTLVPSCALPTCSCAFQANRLTHVCLRRCVLNMRSIEELDGVLRDCLGTCVYNVEYEAIVCRIFEKEVLRGQVRPVSLRRSLHALSLSSPHFNVNVRLQVVSLSEVGVDIDIGPGCLGQVRQSASANVLGSLLCMCCSRLTGPNCRPCSTMTCRSPFTGTKTGACVRTRFHL